MRRGGYYHPSPTGHSQRGVGSSSSVEEPQVHNHCAPCPQYLKEARKYSECGWFKIMYVMWHLVVISADLSHLLWCTGTRGGHDDRPGVTVFVCLYTRDL